ncbi:hypothetical protein AKO1_008587 [Acrasis kona]|uniref:C2 domain-containing protein n=1 Tax=Acrasis kona TaxID=1008807 RepID=A0AAW2YMP5_9EUKA
MKSTRAVEKVKKHMPPSSAVTYSAGELPYHNTPIIFKIDAGVNNEPKLYSRVNTWGESNEDFLAYYKSHGTYPETVWKEYDTNAEGNSIKNADIDLFSLIGQTMTNSVTSLMDGGSINQEENKSDIQTPRDIFVGSCVLDKKTNYLWILDSNLSFVYAPERQNSFADGRIKCKHGDLTSSAGKYQLGSVANLTTGRGPARMGGEFKFNKSKNKWVIDNDSSYSFFRDDKRVISNTRGVKWTNILSSLFTSWNIDLENIVWLDLVQSRKLDSFIVQHISHGYSRMLRHGEMRNGLELMGVKHKYLKIFNNVNVLELLMGAFGANVFFLTQGLLKVQILEAKNINNLFRGFGVLSHYIYCSAAMKGSDGIYSKEWWKSPQRTTSVNSHHSQWNQELNVYVTDRRTQVLEIQLKVDMGEKIDQILGLCDIELETINSGQEAWIPIFGLNHVEQVASPVSDGADSPLDAFSLIGKSVNATLSNLTDDKPMLHVRFIYLPHADGTSLQVDQEQN